MKIQETLLSPELLAQIINRNEISTLQLDDIRYELRRYDFLHFPVRVHRHIHSNGEVTFSVLVEHERRPVHDMPTDARVWLDAINLGLMRRSA